MVTQVHLVHVCTQTPKMFRLTGYGLEQVGAVLHVVVAVVVVGALTEHSALLVGGEELPHSHLEVFGRLLEGVVAVEPLPEQELGLLTRAGRRQLRWLRGGGDDEGPS